MANYQTRSLLSNLKKLGCSIYAVNRCRDQSELKTDIQMVLGTKQETSTYVTARTARFIYSNY